MTDDQKKKYDFEPLHSAHAIEQVIFVLQVEHELDDIGIKKVRDAADEVSTELPKKIDVQSMTFAIGPAAMPTPPPGLTGGKIYQKIRPDGTVECEFRVERMSVIFRTLLYTRWAAIWEQARKYFDSVIPIYIANARISGISLNFVDKFVWDGPISECQPIRLFRPESKYLCPHIYETQDLWHSHTGAFYRIDNQTKRLLNVNVDYIDERKNEEARRVIVIGTVLTDMMNQPGYDPLTVATVDASKFFDSHMQQLHDFGKLVFGNVINNEMAQRIALKD